MLLCQPNNNERLTSLTSSFNYNFRMRYQHHPGQVIAAENPQPAFSAGEDLERKARCRRRIVHRRKIVMRHAPKIKLSVKCAFRLLNKYSTGLTIPHSKPCVLCISIYSSPKLTELKADFISLNLLDIVTFEKT